jgi:hypothetical protein
MAKLKFAIRHNLGREAFVVEREQGEHAESAQGDCFLAQDYPATESIPVKPAREFFAA